MRWKTCQIVMIVIRTYATQGPYAEYVRKSDAEHSHDVLFEYTNKQLVSKQLVPSPNEAARGVEIRGLCHYTVGAEGLVNAKQTARLQARIM